MQISTDFPLLAFRFYRTSAGECPDIFSEGGVNFLLARISNVFISLGNNNIGLYNIHTIYIFDNNIYKKIIIIIDF